MSDAKAAMEEEAIIRIQSLEDLSSATIELDSLKMAKEKTFKRYIILVLLLLDAFRKF